MPPVPLLAGLVLSCVGFTLIVGGALQFVRPWSPAAKLVWAGLVVGAASITLRIVYFVVA